jgi:hypothetical protein
LSDCGRLLRQIPGRPAEVQSHGYGYKNVERLDLKILTCMLPEAPSMPIGLDGLFGPTKHTAKVKRI